MLDSVPNARYSPVCYVLRQWKTSLIPTYRVYRLGIDKLCQHNFENYRQPGAFWIYEEIIGSLDVKVAIRMRTTQVQFY